jgi:hypothetical protein
MGLSQSVRRFYKIFIFLMALLAKTNNTIATIGRNIQYLSQKQELFLQICLVNDKQTIPIKLNLKSCSTAHDKLILSFIRNKTN